MSDLVENPEDRFYHNTTHIILKLFSNFLYSLSPCFSITLGVTGGLIVTVMLQAISIDLFNDLTLSYMTRIYDRLIAVLGIKPPMLLCPVVVENETILKTGTAQRHCICSNMRLIITVDTWHFNKLPVYCVFPL